MKVVLAIYSLGTGGAERAMVELAGHLRQRQWDVTVVTLEADPDAGDFYIVPKGVRRVRVPNAAARGGAWRKVQGNWRRIAALRGLLKDERPDVVLSFMETTNVTCLLAARGLGIPVVVAERTDPEMHLPHVPAPWRHGRRLMYRHAAAVTAQTEAAAAWLRRNCGVPVRVIPNALRRLPPCDGVREPLVLSVGRHVHEKGFDVLLHAFAQASIAHPDWRLAIVGNGPLRSKLQDQANALGIASRVEWPGTTQAIEVWYARAAIVAQASRFEGFPNVLLEAMGMGAAVISTDCRSGPREIISSGKNGLLVPVDDAAALALGLQRLITEPALRHDLGLRAQYVRAAYSEEHILERWRELLEAAAATNRRQPLA